MQGGEDSHRYFEDMAVTHVLGGLTDPDTRVFREHLLTCSHCRARVGELRAIAHDLADVERNEQRERSAQILETKRRADEEDDQPATARRTPRSIRPLVVLAAVSALVALAAWNVSLRAGGSALEEQLRHSQEAAAILEFGASGTVISTASGVDGLVSVRDARLVVLIDGLADDQVYGLYVQDSDGLTVFRHPIRSRDGRVLSWIELPEGASTVLVTATGGMPAAEPSGTTVLHAQVP
jgi:anti-sigma factor RsiW